MVDFRKIMAESRSARAEGAREERLEVLAQEARAEFVTLGDEDRQQPVAGVVLEGRQLVAVEAACSGRSVLITGPGGTGKSEVTKEVVGRLRGVGRKVAVCASTGIAAVSIGGMTIHSTLGLGIAGSRADATKRLGSDTVAKAQERLYRINTIVIDEVSMLTGDYIDMMDWWLNMVREKGPGQFEPFGGYQMVFVGDFLQLPPVLKDGQPCAKKYAFEADAWSAAKVAEVYLRDSHRQADPEMYRHLCRIRRGIVDDETVEFFRPSLRRQLDDPTRLVSTNAAAADINSRRLRDHKGEIHEWEATFEGNPKWFDALRRDCIAEDILALKVGAPVLFIKNNYEAGFVNGQRGTVVGVTAEQVIVEKVGGDTVHVDRAEWKIENSDQRVLASMSQFPLKLAWAITIHKSQGMSLDNVSVDLSGCFERGQAYVALSRARTMAGLSLSVLPDDGNVRASGKVVNYYKALAVRMREQEASQ